MKFRPEAGDFPLEQDSCKADYAQARELGRVRLGQRALYFSHLTWTGVLPWTRWSGPICALRTSPWAWAAAGSPWDSTI